ncbi:MAG: glycoside hydrolase 43 family protein [Prevotella sp.]|nr:glycoside hydrolase 43 family protein [Prevotella sp.]
MRKTIIWLLAVWCWVLSVKGQTLLEWGDQNNGTYKNPVLNADYSDPDVIRVGSKYYMVASDFHFIGMQVLESDDMVNWQIVSQIYSRFDLPGWDENKHYGGGSWAPSIRWHNGRFYVYFCTPEEGLFMSSATDAHGPWEPLHCVKAVPKWEDPCPLFDDDGQAYLGRSQHGAGPIIVHKMSADGKTLLDDGVTVYQGPVAEGTKWLKRNGYYYLIIPEGGVGYGWQTVLRSRNIYGPYERRIVLEQGSTQVNGPHQGALVDTPEGEWWFYHFQSTPALGRVVHLQPARWKDDWPLMGVDIDGNGIGEPVSVWKKPDVHTENKSMLPQTSDDFSNTQLGLQWQWCHNPDNEHWSLTERQGWLTLKALPSPDLKNARNMLTQKTMGYQGEASTLMYCGDIKEGTYAGLLCIGREYRGIGVCSDGIYLEDNGKREIVIDKKPSMVYIRISLNVLNNQHQFYYSLDGKDYLPIGLPFEMHEGNWKGFRIGLYCYGNDGKVQFDNFEYNITK